MRRLPQPGVRADPRPATGSRLRRHVVGTTAAVTLVAMAVLTILVQATLATTVHADVDRLLDARAEAVAATLATRGGRVVALETATEVLDRTAWVFDRAGTMIEGPRTDGRVLRTLQRLAATSAAESADVGGTRLFATPVTVAGSGPGSAVVVVAVDLAPYERAERYALVVSLVVSTIAVAGAVGVSVWSLRRALEPVALMSARARDWSEHDLDRRFGLGEPHDEISGLARTFDDLLARVADVIRAEQRLSQEMAHELRTPLAAVRAEAELAADRPGVPAETRSALERIMAASDTMSAAISTLMALARSVQASGHTDLGQALHDMAGLRAGASALSVGPVPDGLYAAAPPELVARALAPLVDNARRHARTSVRLSASADDREVSVHVEDDGPGLGVDDPEELFRPGRRDPRSDGAGLGLALARRVARSAGGDVRAVPDPSGGNFVLTLPRARGRTSP